jgi:putative ABC transport system substrate-binding protein
VITRRAIMTTLALTVIAPREPARAQALAKTPTVAWVSSSSRFGEATLLEALRAHGYVPGQNLVFGRFAATSGKADEVPAIAERVIAGRPDVIVVSNPHSLDAMLRATRAIPVVGIDLDGDPAARGWLANAARPGGNLTGIFVDVPEITGRQLQLLREVKPDLTRVAVLGDARLNALQLGTIERAARGMGLTVHALSPKTFDEIAGALADAAWQRANGLMALPSPLVSASLPLIAQGAIKHRLAAVSPLVPAFAEAGGLIAYGPDLPDLFRRGGDYVARILKGAKPADLPVQRPEKFALVVNANTARALGLSLPAGVLKRAARVIE